MTTTLSTLPKYTFVVVPARMAVGSTLTASSLRIITILVAAPAVDLDRQAERRAAQIDGDLIVPVGAEHHDHAGF